MGRSTWLGKVLNTDSALKKNAIRNKRYIIDRMRNMHLSKLSTYLVFLCILGVMSACRLSTPGPQNQISPIIAPILATTLSPSPTRTIQVPVTRAPTATLTPVPTEPPWTCTPGSFTNHLNIMSEERSYNLHVPPGFTQGMPLMINLHGYNSTAEEEEEYTSTSLLADKEGFIVTYPQALHDPASWDVEPGEGNVDIPFIRALIDSIEKHCGSDPRRVYVTGMSNGGGMTNRVGCDLSKQVAAIAPVAGAYGFFGVCDIKRPLPVIAFHGTEDEMVPYEGSGAPESLNVSMGVWPPILYWAATWALRDSCASRPTVISNKNGILHETWGGCRDDVEVTLYTIDGGKHVWPGYASDPRDRSAFHASRIIWDFFKKYSLPQ
jgi:polyhydroxybutyrate depolymerase